MSQDAAGAVRPTLFIGLGGTGKEILLRLRRSFYERWRVPGLPITAYLWIDTDPRDVVVSGEQLDELDIVLKFQEHEKISLLSGSVKDGLGAVLSEKLRYPHIHSWLPEEVETYGSTIANGAGAVRSIGRLTFFDQVREIDHSVRTAVDTISKNPQRVETIERYLPNADITDPQAFLVFSIAGGTGGGTFLDMAFLLKSIYPNIKITGVAVLPNVYFVDAHEEDAARCYGNAYSALKELEHYSRRVRLVKAAGDESRVSIEYEVDWTGHNPKRVQGPPFDALYLSELINEANVSAGHRGELFRAIAQSMFLDFLPGRFSTQKRSKAANLAQSLSSVEDDSVPVAGTTLRQSFSRRYAAFGLSKIEIPIESIREACACRLAAEVIEGINRSPGDPNLMGALSRQAHGRFDIAGLEGLLGLDWKDVIEKDLQAVCPPRWSADIESSAEKLGTFVNGLGKNLDVFEHRHLNAQGQDPKEWGTVVSLIRNSTRPATKKLRDRLREWVLDTLDKPELGLNALLGEAGLMALLVQSFRKIHKAPAPTESAARQQKANNEAAAYKKQRDDALNEMRLALGNRLIWLLGAKSWTLSTLYGQARDAADQQAKARAAGFLAEEAAKLAKAGEDYLLEVKAMLESFAERLPPMQGHFRELEESLLDFRRTYSSIRVFSRDDFENFYLLNFDEESLKHRPVDVRKEYEGFLRNHLGPKQQTLDLIETWQREGDIWLRAQLRIYASTRFKEDFDGCRQERDRHSNCGRFVEVLKLSLLKHDAKAKYDQFVNGALPMLRRSKRFPGATGQETASVYLGVPSRTGEPYASFIVGVRQRLRAHGYDLNDSTDIIDSDDPTSVYLFVETHAFALPTLPLVVDDCHEAYYDYYRRTGKEKRLRTSAIPLHASSLWEGEFDDLRPISQDLAFPSLQALEILSLGPILGVVGVQTDGNRRKFLYKDWRGAFSVDVPLGNKREAIEILRRDKDLRETLLRQLVQREAAWTGAAAPVVDPTVLPAPGVIAGPTSLDYFWSLIYLNVKLFPESTPEYSIVQRRLKTLGRVHEGAADMTDLSPEVREERCREKLRGRATWVGDLPVLNGLAPVQVGRDEVVGL